MLKYFNKIYIPLFVFSIVCASCSTNIAGRKQVRLLSSQQMASLGDSSFSQLKTKMKTHSNPKYQDYVKCITVPILKTLGEDPQAWEILVFDESSPNAFALPGKNIGVHHGMIELTQNQHQLAAVIGHEIAHVTARHGNERMSQSLVVQGGLTAAQIYLGQGSQKDQQILAALGIGAQFGILLPFSRKQESEADSLGLNYSTKAGFSPRGAVELWQLMKNKSGGSPPEFLSTHPSHSTRIQELTRLQSEMLPIYESVTNKPSCQLVK